MSEKELNDAKLTLATLCDMVLGEDAKDRSDDALVRAVGILKREHDVAKTNALTCLQMMEQAQNECEALRETIGQMEHEANTQHAAALDLQAQRDAALAKLSEYEGENKRWHSFETVQAIVRERDAAKQSRARLVGAIRRWREIDRASEKRSLMQVLDDNRKLSAELYAANERIKKQLREIVELSKERERLALVIDSNKFPNTSAELISQLRLEIVAEKERAEQAEMLLRVQSKTSKELNEYLVKMENKFNAATLRAEQAEANFSKERQRAEQAEADARALAKLLKEVDDANPHMAYSAKAYWVIRKYLNSERA